VGTVCVVDIVDIVGVVDTVCVVDIVDIVGVVDTVCVVGVVGTVCVVGVVDTMGVVDTFELLYSKYPPTLKPIHNNIIKIITIILYI
jgi:hypothetical protein